MFRSTNRMLLCLVTLSAAFSSASASSRHQIEKDFVVVSESSKGRAAILLASPRLSGDSGNMQFLFFLGDQLVLRIASVYPAAALNQNSRKSAREIRQMTRFEWRPGDGGLVIIQSIGAEVADMDPIFISWKGNHVSRPEVPIENAVRNGMKVGTSRVVFTGWSKSGAPKFRRLADKW